MVGLLEQHMAHAERSRARSRAQPGWPGSNDSDLEYIGQLSPPYGIDRSPSRTIAKTFRDASANCPAFRAVLAMSA